MKKALVLGGGGARGAYECGVWRSLRENNQSFDIIVGTSIGALMATLIGQKQYKVAKELWENISIDQVVADGINLDFDWELMKDQKEKILPLLSKAIKEKGMDTSPLYERIRQLTDIKRLRNSKTAIYITTMEVPSFKPLTVNLKEIAEEEIADYLMASAACFPILPIKDIGEKKYIDGGYHDNVPIAVAIEKGATEIIAVDLKAPGLVKKIKRKDVPVTMIEPYWPLGAFFSFNGQQAKRNMTLGYLDGQKAFGKLQGYAYSFNSKSTSLKDLSIDLNEEIIKINNKRNNKLVGLIELKLNSFDQRLLERNNRHVQKEDLVLRLLERLLQLQDYDPTKVYDLEKVIKKIKSSIVKGERSDIKEWLDDFIKNPKALLEEFETWDFLVALAEELGDLDSEIICLLYKLLPSETLAGLLIGCLKRL